MLARRAGEPLGPVSDRSSARALVGPAWLGIGLGLVFHAGSIVLSYALVAAITPVRDPLPVIGCIAVARLSILLPISPSGLGFQEGALSLLFLRIALPAETALAAALLNRVALLVTSGLGVALLLARRHEAAVDPGAEPPAKARSGSRAAIRPIPGSQADGAR